MFIQSNGVLISRGSVLRMNIELRTDKMRKRKYTDDELRLAVKNSISIAGTLKKIGLVPVGGNYIHIKSIIHKLNIDTSHFKGQAHNKGKVFGSKRPIEDYLSDKPKAKISSNELKKRLIKEGIFIHRCDHCKLKKWLQDIIPLELHHRDGSPGNNYLANLQLLCPNCHYLTDNYSGKNIKNKSVNSTKE